MSDTLEGVRKAAQDAANAAYGDSNDREIELLQDALSLALSALGLGYPDAEPGDA